MGGHLFDLSGKTVVVTGGGRGIGRGIVRALARANANIVISGRGAGPLAETAEEVASIGAPAIVVPCDVTRMADLQHLADAALDRFGAIHGWINNAGSASPGDVGPLIGITEQQWDAVVDLNLKWTFFACQIAAKAMTDGGSIVNVTSRSASQPNPMTGQYGAAKAGVENLTATMAVEWGHMGIRVNGIAPGVVVTEQRLSEGSMKSESRRQRQIDTVPLRRLGVVDDVGPLAVYLVSDEAQWISGAIVPVNGGSRVPVGYLSYLHHVNERMKAKESA
ncbi:MAG: SDR family oxidoreductase [Sphingomonadaceae bacterium]|nr:SDR family oxidoreductase [Sphingomonadaceae bacterium]